MQDQRLAMCLTDTSGAIDMHINDFLVISDLAEFAESAKDVPTQDLEQSCELISIELGHPNPKDITDCFKGLGINLLVKQKKIINYKATFKCPKGQFTL